MTTNKKTNVSGSKEIAAFTGKIVAFNNSLKLYHWHVKGLGSYAIHIALDQALDTLLDVTDRIVETTYALEGDLHIVIPETSVPKDIIPHVEAFYAHIEASRSLFPEAFTQSILDDYQESLQQLLYRLKRLE